MEANIDNAMDIVKKAAYRLFYKKYRGYLKDWDEFFSDAQFLAFQKIAKFDASIGTFEGYINMYVEFAAIRILSTNKKQQSNQTTYIGTIDDVGITEKEIPEELDFLVRRAMDIANEPGIWRCDSVRKRLKEELTDLGWSATRTAKAFQEISDAISGTRTKCYAKKEES